VIDPYWQYQVPLWILILFLLAFSLLPMELGYRLGKWRTARQPRPDSDGRGDVALTAMLALLGLMLAFTYSFSLSRADLRKVALVNEVNAVGTAFLRADLLPEPSRTEVRDLLFEYAKSLHINTDTLNTREDVQKAIGQTVQIQSKLWPAVKAALEKSTGITGAEKALVVSSINDVLDSYTRLIAVFFDRLPTPVLALLIVIVGASLSVAAYNAGLQSSFMRGRMTVFALVLAILMYIILDYDMMYRGLIQVDSQSLALLVYDMGKELHQ